ncbi:pelargonidin 3-O-(6-caffeoylglucoside) 5-O-(6-O-malonylglucoside) 4'''-malonyltransferase-like isoform X2 [Olea europaea var. sylvestris]|uniref:pelargonidin 3-O-(6-caffeoylglucoside) 5-O-(6-O-malonylglucoside) 4'''-malonyltransferase-like isoform X2 n=1 Tax=Olea europaea var. sylvestris TaxID=158386 RepID=UPI000C1D4CEC|nr:pelargonidin 3-O-(6-caffeoylglucoside) 5-O-(6-O-malonylglucoside) 4'''-malonyltransferase-like isoform X2 [Olea europaea var. sylvestris]
MKVKILSRKLIKPCTPTPETRQRYKIASIDEINPTMNVVGILYYPFNDKMEHVLNKMEESLAQVLPQFYPFAGRYIKKAYSVDCNDEGAEYVEAQVDSELLDIIGSGVEPGELNDLLPLEVGAADLFTDPVLSIQINKFKCGGIAIGTCISHRIVDACSLGIFLSAWTKATRGDSTGEPIIPNFDSPFYFPGRNLGELDFGTSRTRDSNIVTKRILFGKKVIANLRDRVNHLYVKRERPPSRVLMVTSFLTEALLRSDRAKLGKPRACLIHVAANIRERTIPPLSKYSCGNLVSMGLEEYAAEETKSLDFERLVPIVDSATRKAVAECTNLLSDGEFGYKVMVDEYIDICEKSNDDNLNCLWFTDWSKFGYYEKDFGFGTPIWTSIVNIPVKNLIILMNTKEDDGIEAWLHLHKEDMPYFEQDEEIKKLVT